MPLIFHSRGEMSLSQPNQPTIRGKKNTGQDSQRSSTEAAQLLRHSGSRARRKQTWLWLSLMSWLGWCASYAPSVTAMRSRSAYNWGLDAMAVRTTQ